MSPSNLCLCLFFGSVIAMEAAPKAPAPTKQEKPAAEPEKYELKRRSSFELADTTRPPFWPIGWVKRVATAAGPTAVAVVAAPVAVLDAKDFVLTSILLGSPSLAVINGRPYSEGETVRLPKTSTMKVKVQVQRIVDGQVILQSGDQVLAIKQRRGELNSLKNEAELLNEDK